MAKSKKASGPPDPHTLRMAANARKELDRRSWSYEDLAPRIGRSVPQVKRLMNPRGPNGRRHWDAHDIFAVAGALGIGASAASALIAEMEREGLIESRASALTLTAAGREYALQVVRAHRLWERYLDDETDLPLTAIHLAADRASTVFRSTRPTGSMRRSGTRRPTRTGTRSRRRKVASHRSRASRSPTPLWGTRSR